MKTIVFFLRPGLLLACLFVFTSTAPCVDGLAEDLLKYTNDYRKSKNLSTLEMRTDLNALARKHSEDMAAGRRSFGHSGYEQRVQKIKKIFKSCSVAENVAYGAPNAKKAFDIWKNSSGHRKNMLGNYRYVGIGTARNKRGVLYYTEIFVR
jgi:uncharacterized protein YkwD